MPTISLLACADYAAFTTSYMQYYPLGCVYINRMINQPLDPRQEQRLVTAATENEDAFRRLYDYYLPRVYAYVGYRVGPVGDVEDVVAEVFAKMSGGLRRFVWRGPGSFSAWLFRIAHNEIAGHYRRMGPHIHDVPLEASPEAHGEHTLAGSTLESAEHAALIRELLNDLPPRQREVILLKYFGNLRNREIGQILELDEHTVASHLSRGLNKLRRRLPEDLKEA
jgi:RNA polymerase sigma-70 factor (ECF subfamily)